MALYREFRYGDGVLYGATSRLLKFYTEQTIQGGAIHGKVDVVWDVSEFDAKGVIIVANRRTPATVPEEGNLVYHSYDGVGFNPEILISGRSTYTADQGSWTYFSLFIVGTSGHPEWVAFSLFLPVSDWRYTESLPRLMPGVSINQEMNVQSEPDQENLLVKILQEFAFQVDEAKSAAEALVPFWAKDNIIPQAAPTIASLMRIPYIPDLGPKVYTDLVHVMGYADNTLDVLGEKIQAVVRYMTSCRLSSNYLLNLNDSSAEGPNIYGPPHSDALDGRYHRSAWTNDADQLPFRKEFSYPNDPPPASYSFYDLRSRAFFQFPEGRWTCGDPNSEGEKHAIGIRTWPSTIGGFYARLPEGSSKPVMVELSLVTISGDFTSGPTNSGLQFRLVQQLITSNEWNWFPSEGVIPMSTDIVGFPYLSVVSIDPNPDIDTKLVDLDVILIGPGVHTSITIPVMDVFQTFINDGDVGVEVRNGPSFGTAVIDWGDPYDARTTEIAWERLVNEGAPHTYRGSVGEAPVRRNVTIKDSRDQWLYCSGSVEMTTLETSGAIGP